MALPEESSTTPVVFDQKACRYVPHVFGVQVGQPIEILNSDATLHNIHATPKTNAEFNQAQPLKGKAWTMAVVSDGRLFARTDSQGVCLDVAPERSAAPAPAPVEDAELSLSTLAVTVASRCSSAINSP